MIISGPDLHQATWERLAVLCELFSVELERAEDKLGRDVGPGNPWELQDHFLWVPEGTEDEFSPEYLQSRLEVARFWLDIVARKVESKDSIGLRDDFEEFAEAALAGLADVEYFYDEVEGILTILEIKEGTLLYLPPAPLIEIPNQILCVSDQLLRKLSGNPQLLYSLHPRQFEELIAEIFFRNGFEVELTKATRDGGKDIVAIYNKMNLSTKYIIECKRYSERNKVSLAMVQRLLGVKVAAGANKAILATTSTFTQDAIAFTSNHIWDLELKDYDDIVSWLTSCT